LNLPSSNLPSLANLFPRSVIRAAWVVLAAVPACGSDAGPLLDAGVDAGACSHPSSSRLGPDESYGSGIITGVDVSASVCNVGVLLYDSPDTFPPGQLLMALDYESENSVFDFQRPAGAYGGTLEGIFSVGTPTTGVYVSANDPTPCGGMSFDYALPVLPGTVCGGGTPPDCPAGCTPDCISSISGTTCNTCIPRVVSLGFEASVRSNCVSGIQPIMGSWTLRLTSIAANQPDAGAPSTYTAHGQLTASLVGTSPSDTVTFALAF
jgi:hypothetical protein